MRRRQRERSASFDIGEPGGQSRNVTIEDNVSIGTEQAARVRGNVDRALVRRNMHRARSAEVEGWRRVAYNPYVVTPLAGLLLAGIVALITFVL